MRKKENYHNKAKFFVAILKAMVQFTTLSLPVQGFSLFSSSKKFKKNMKKLSSFLARIALLSFCLLAVAPAIVPVLSEANAGSAISGDVNDNALVTTMCKAMQLVTGNAGKAFAAFAIISMGIGFFTGKISWGLMIGLALGIAAMFGAPTIVSALSGKNAYDCD